MKHVTRSIEALYLWSLVDSDQAFQAWFLGWRIADWDGGPAVDVVQLEVTQV